jgi:hypothetical protein
MNTTVGNQKKVNTQPVHVRPVAFKKLQMLSAKRVLETGNKQVGADVIDFLLDFYEKNQALL